MPSSASTCSARPSIALRGALLALATACAPSLELPTPSRELVLPGEGHLETLDNGLRLFIAPDPYTRLIQVDLRVQVGSRDDPPDRPGTAHLVEHLMFALPADGPGSPTLIADAQHRALWFGGTTTADHTHYADLVDAEHLEAVFRHTAQRLAFDCTLIDDDAFARNREIVRNELRWHTQGIDVEIRRKLLAQVFPADHPYRRLDDDSDAQLAAITREEACEFARRHYSPARATVVVTGDVTPEQVLPLARAHLEPLPAGQPEPRRPLPPLALAGRHERVEVATKDPGALVLFELPPRFSADHTAAEAATTSVVLAVDLLTGGSRSAVAASLPVALGGDEARVFGIAVVPTRPDRLAAAIDEVHTAIDRVLATEIDESRLYDRMRQQRRRDVVDSIAWMPGRARTYAAYLDAGVSPSHFRDELAAIDDLTPAQVHAMGRQLFARERALVIELVPGGEAALTELAELAELGYEPASDDQVALPDDIDPAEAGRPLPFDDIAPPELEQLDHRLANGMRVLLVRSSQYPVMDAQVIVGAGWLDAPEHPELPLLAMRLYGPHEGGRFGSSRDAWALFQHFDQSGSSMSATIDPHSTTYRASGLSIYLDFILAGLAERVVQGDYQSGTFDAWKEGYQRALEGPETARQIAIERTISTALYGEGHPHGYAQAGDLDALRRLGQRDLWRFHDERYRAANCTLVIVGGFDMPLAVDYIEAFFESPRLRRRRSSWQEPVVERPRPAVPEPAPGGPSIFTATSEDLVQTTMSLAFPLAEIYGDDHAALMVLAAMLDLEVRAVRERLGASYGVDASLHADQPRLEISGEVDSARAGEALAEVLAALERLRKGEGFERRFAFARRGVLGKMIDVQADATQLAAALAQAVRNGRSYDYYRELARHVATLEPEAVTALIDRVLDPKRSVTLLLGPPDGVRKAVEHNRLEGVRDLGAPEA
jgi:zinc protease